MASKHIIDDFVSFCGETCMMYLDNDTFYRLKEYIRDEVDTSNWYRCDIIEVYMTHDCSESPEIFVWDGYTVCYPFYGGSCNDYQSDVKKNIDDVIHRNGFMPEIFKAYFDYDPNSVFFNDDISFPSKTGFTNLSKWYDEIKENVFCLDNVQTCYGNSTVHICKFDGDKHLIFIGDFDSDIESYICNNNPYDFDIANLIFGYNLDVDFDTILRECGSEEGDDFFFIHPRHINMNYNVRCDSTYTSVPTYSSSKFFGSSEKKQKTRKVDDGQVKTKRNRRKTRS